MADLIGQSLGQYKIIEQLGSGGVVTAFKAVNTRLQRDVVVKVLNIGLFAPEVRERILKRFDREAPLLTRLSHPSIVKVYDYGRQEGLPYLVLEYFPSGTLTQRLGKPVRWDESVRLLLPIAQALVETHAQGYIHGDIQPTNILLTRRNQPMLSDFGFTRILNLEDGLALTSLGETIGTSEYLPPEQGKGKTLSSSVDVYALGMILYELIAGSKASASTVPLRQLAPTLPDKAEKLLIQVLDKNPENRYLDMKAFTAALQGLISGSGMPKFDTTPSRSAEVEGQTRDTGAAPAIPETYAGAVSRADGEFRKASAPARKKSWLPWVIGIGLTLVALILVGIFGLRGFLTNPPAELTPVSTSLPENLTTLVPTLNIRDSLVREADRMTMVFVPEGGFMMGTDNGDPEEDPMHGVSLDSFWIDQTEVTNRMYALCVQAEVCPPPANVSSSSRTVYYGDERFNDYPVIYVDWSMADTYCTWTGSRLPTEAEWEKAARGVDRRSYPWGNAVPACRFANYWGTGGGCVGDTSPVGSYLFGASPYGALDLAGNVWEWVSDWYGVTYYRISPLENPFGPDSGVVHSTRGGSWMDTDSSIRTGRRIGGYTGTSYFLGFRCASDLFR